MEMPLAYFNLRDDSVLSFFAHKEDKPLMRLGAEEKTTTCEAVNAGRAPFSASLLLLFSLLYLVVAFLSIEIFTYLSVLLSNCLYINFFVCVYMIISVYLMIFVCLFIYLYCWRIYMSVPLMYCCLSVYIYMVVKMILCMFIYSPRFPISFLATCLPISLLINHPSLSFYPLVC